MFTGAAQVADVCTAAVGLMVAVEGIIVGLTKAIFDRAKERARQEGREEGREEGRLQEQQRLRSLGVRIPPEALIEENGRNSSTRNRA